MIKKFFWYIVSLFTLFAVIGIGYLFYFEKQILNLTKNTIQTYEYIFFCKKRDNLVNFVKNSITNHYRHILKNAKKNAEIKAQNNINTIKAILEVAKNNNQCYICILNELLIKRSIKNIRLIDINNKILSSSNPLEIGKKIKLACDPFKNFGRCFVIKNNTYYLVEFLPSVNIIISTLTPIINTSDIEKNIINILKTYPKIIIFKNHKTIKGKFDLNHFYIFDEFKPLNIFIGIGIKYNELDEIINTYIKNIEKSTYHYFSYFILTYLVLILFIYTLIFVFLRSRLDIVEKAFNEFKQKARFDKLTNLYNREGFETEYKKAKYGTLLILDLDNFTDIPHHFQYFLKFTILSFLRCHFLHTSMPNTCPIII